MLPIIYASTSGNVELVCEYVHGKLLEQGKNTSLHRAEATAADILNQHSHFILATSTWEHGEINPFFAKFLAEMSGMNLENKHAWGIGLGDTRYEPVLFCKGIEIVLDKFAAQGGSVAEDILKLNGEPHHQLESVVLPWIQTNLL